MHTNKQECQSVWLIFFENDEGVVDLSEGGEGWVYRAVDTSRKQYSASPFPKNQPRIIGLIC